MKIFVDMITGNIAVWGRRRAKVASRVARDAQWARIITDHGSGSRAERATLQYSWDCDLATREWTVQLKKSLSRNERINAHAARTWLIWIND